MHAIMPFNFHGNPLRVQMRQFSPWFVAQDVCRILGLGEPANAIATASLEADEYATCDITTPKGAQSLTMVSETGLFGLASVSLASARKSFLPWLRREVLPVLDEVPALRLHEQIIERRLSRELDMLADSLRDEFMVDVQSIVVASRPVHSPQTVFMHCYQPTCPACAAEGRAKDAGTDADETADDHQLSDADVQAFVDAVTK